MISHKIDVDLNKKRYQVNYYENGVLIASLVNDSFWLYPDNKLSENEVMKKIDDYIHRLGYEPQAWPTYQREKDEYEAKEIVKKYGDMYVIIKNDHENFVSPGLSGCYYLYPANETDTSLYGFHSAQKLKELDIKEWVKEILFFKKTFID